jgi:hypothetical protein
MIFPRAEAFGRQWSPRRASGTWATVRAGLVAREPVVFPVAVGLLHLALVQVVASLAFLTGTANDSSPPYKSVLGDPPAMTGLAHLLVEPLRQWDGLWYALIAREGYGPVTLPGGTYPLDARAAFWPLLPGLMRLGHEMTGWSVEAVGYLIGNLAFFGALLLLYRLVRLDFDRSIARRTLVALALFPTAFFFSAVYTESLFLLLAVGALLAARQGQWLVAGGVGLLAALTRSQGVLLLLPFAVLLLQEAREAGWRLDVRRWAPRLLFAALPILGPALFGLHLDRVQESEEGRDWLAFVTAQKQWDRFSATPWETVRCAVEGCTVPGEQFGFDQPYLVRGADWSWLGDLVRAPSWDLLTSGELRGRAGGSDTLELVCLVLFIALGAIGFRLLPLYQSAYLWPQLVVPLFGPSIVSPLMSLPRFGLVLFPLFVVAALLVRARSAALPLLAVSTLLLIVLTAQFAQWYWVS